ncbi:beta family protein [Oceanidesulfovibrio marinus]|nr:beta family protein [Oceanidesulfovibrio marinus]
MPYVPIVRTKAGELDAFARLLSHTVQGLIPCLELQPLEWEATKVQKNLESWAKKLQRSWPWETRCLLDLNVLDGSPWLGSALQALTTYGPSFTPVVTQASSPAFHSAISPYTEHDMGLCLRLNLNSQDLSNDISQLLSHHAALTADKIDVIVDFGAHTSIPLSIAPAITQTIASLPHVTDFRMVAFAATTFPENMAGFQRGISPASRGEWAFWQALRSQPALPRRIEFSDYTAAYPSDGFFDPLTMQMGAKIKYTADSHWVIVKGQGIKGRGYEQYRTLCADLMQLPEYCGSSFSWGDEFIEQCANGGKLGNARTWVSVAVNHHVVFVRDQLANLGVL